MSYVEDAGEHTQLQPKTHGAMITCDCGSPYCQGQIVIPWKDVPELIWHLLYWGHQRKAIPSAAMLEMRNAAVMWGLTEDQRIALKSRRSAGDGG
jgi:hypothetical protein